MAIDSGTSATGTEFSSDIPLELQARAAGEAAAGLGPYRLAWRRLRRNRAALAFGALFALILLLCLLAPVYAHDIAHTGPNDNHITETVRVGGKLETVVNAIARLGSGFFTPACFLLPPGITGHPTGACPYGDPTKPDLAKAKELVKQSGMAGTAITVWGEERTPRRQFVDYYTSFLNEIGFKATEKIIADATYFPTIGNLKLNAQTGFADWNEDFPNPIDFYGILLAGDAILPTNNQNFGQVNDPVINSKVNALGSLYRVPTSSLSAVASQWQALDEYGAKKAYMAVFGYASFPKFASDRLDYGASTLHTVFGWDWLTFKLK